jgi:hypothetical protein
MMMPGRTYSAMTVYRYGFNGQEHSSDVANGSYTADFWQYDARTGRRWNLDPKPSPSVSVYNCFSGNPIWFNDFRGDTLDIPSNYGGNAKARAASQEDIYSLLTNQENKQFFKIDDKGRVSMDRANLTKENEKNQYLRDPGFALLTDMINDTKVYYYAASEKSTADVINLLTGEKLRGYSFNLFDKYPVGSTISHDATKIVQGKNEVSDVNLVLKNYSFTLRGTENKEGYLHHSPSKRYTSGLSNKVYDGYVAIARGEFYDMQGATKVIISRAAIVYHELLENYFRVNGSSYDDAHNGAIWIERIHTQKYPNTSLGETPKFFDVKN